MENTSLLAAVHKDTTVAAGKKVGRRKGGRKRGYYFRTGRGWFALIEGKSVPMTDQGGGRLENRQTPIDVLEAAHKRLVGEVVTVGQGSVQVMEVVRAYLDHCQHANRAKTYDVRSRLLFDFCTGYPAKFRNNTKSAQPKDRIHSGYGALLARDLTVKHVADWCNAHKGWTSHRMAKQAVKRAFTWAATAEVGLLKENPLAGLKVPRSKRRITYFTPEQEDAIYEHCYPATAMLIKTLIRTGCRPGELISVTAKHVEEWDKGLIWRFRAHEHKTGEIKGDRIVRLPDEIAQLTRELMAKHPKGPIFRNSRGNPFNETAIRSVFARLKTRLKKKGVQLDDDACLYSCRHTYAKRMLGGYWNGKPCTIEVLCALMGNSREIAWEHYGKWCAAYDAPLWDAVN